MSVMRPAACLMDSQCKAEAGNIDLSFPQWEELDLLEKGEGGKADNLYDDAIESGRCMGATILEVCKNTNCELQVTKKQSIITQQEQCTAAIVEEKAALATSVESISCN